jgi:hypothetical protein
MHVTHTHLYASHLPTTRVTRGVTFRTDFTMTLNNKICPWIVSKTSDTRVCPKYIPMLGSRTAFYEIILSPRTSLLPHAFITLLTYINITVNTSPLLSSFFSPKYIPQSVLSNTKCFRIFDFSYCSFFFF